MARHTHTGKYAGRPGRCTHGTGVTQAVVLAVGLSADTGEAPAVHDTLESPTFGSTDDIDESTVFRENVADGKDVAEIQLPREIRRKFDEFALGRGSCLFEMPLERRAGVLFCGFVIGKLYSGITIFFNCTELRNNARTSLDNSAWHILTLGTENGSHSDFFSN